MTDPDPTIARAGDSAELLELRLALVCYGGVSLAVYMHGVTKELHALLRASRAFDRAFGEASAADLARSPHRPHGGTEAAYFDQLVELAAAGVPVSATVDVVAGTSAGGINGICLAKATVCDAGQDALTDLWMTKGDIGELMRHGGLGGWVGALRTVIELPAKLDEPWAPLKGDDMCRWLYDALHDMGRGAEPGRTLLPTGGTLDLFVTATDLHGTDRIVPLGIGGGLHDRTYERMFSFHYDPAGGDTIGAGDDGMLAYAARATSSFPGAFPPITLADFTEAVRDCDGGKAFDPDRARRDHMAEYAHLRGVDATRVPMLDGGLLANAPFDPVVDCIAQKPAARQVSRHLLFIEPDPGAASVGASLDEARKGRRTDGEPPTWAGTLRSTMTIRQQQSLTEAVTGLADLNTQVATIGEVVRSLRGDVERALEELQLSAAVDLTFPRLAEHANEVYRAVPGLAGRLSYRVYGRLKMEKVASRLADDLAEFLAYPRTSPEASFLHAALLAWTQSCAEWSSTAEGDIDRWLSGLDAPYRERRLEFLIDGINALFARDTRHRVGSGAHGTAAGPSRQQLSRAKDVTWGLLVEERTKPARAVRRLGDVAAFADRESLSGLVLTEDPRTWAREHDAEIGRLVDAYRDELAALTADSAQRLWDAFTTTTRDWPDSGVRRDLASRYVGFPLWDALLFPTQSLSGLPMLTPVRVSRISPVDATAFGDVTTAAAKLKGVSLHHFGAFFALDRRENDYLWGRLDGVELLLRLLRQQRALHGPDGSRLGRSQEIQREALAGVLDEEQGRLEEKGTRELIQDLRQRVVGLEA